MKISQVEVYTDAPTPEGIRLMEMVSKANGHGKIHFKLPDDFNKLIPMLARTLTVPCPECRRTGCNIGMSGDFHCTSCSPDDGRCNFYKGDCPTCSGTGTITVLDAWEREMKESA